MGESSSGKSAALRKGKERRSPSSPPADDAGPVARPKKEREREKEKDKAPGATTAYKRGGPRPWEAARARRDAEDAARGAEVSSAASSLDSDAESAFVRAGLPREMVRSMNKAGLRRTTEIQRLAIPELARGEDVVILAETGSGKTFAYALPMIAAVGAPGRGGTKVQGRCCPAMIVLVPNVELGRQVAHAAELASEWVGAAIAAEHPAASSAPPRPPPAVFSLLGKEKKLLRPTAPRQRGAAKTAAIKRKVREKALVRAARVAAREAAEAAARGEGASAAEASEAGEAAAAAAGSRASEEANRGAARGAAVPAGKKGSKMRGDAEVIPEFRRAEILVATPARLLGLMRDGWVMPGRIRHVVVDEADEMLGRGFGAEVASVVDATFQGDGVNRFGARVQYCFAAATMREEGPILDALANTPRLDTLRWISTKQFGETHPQLRLRVREVSGDDGRDAALVDALRGEDASRALVFVSSPAEADAVVKRLGADGFDAMAFHGRTNDRGVALDEFFAGDLSVLVCTDLAARGIDFPDLHHVVQYRPAADADTHLHRCGRTARTGQEGPFVVTCLVDREADELDEEVERLMERAAARKN